MDINITPVKGARAFRDELSSIILDSSSSVPLHCQLSGSLRKLIASDKWDQQRFPAEGDLATLLGVSVSTVRQALAPLAAEKLIDRRRAKGSFVNSPQNAKALRYVTVIIPNYESSVLLRYMEAIHRHAALAEVEIQIIEVNKGGDWKDVDSHVKYPAEQGGVIFLTPLPLSAYNLFNLLGEKGYRSVSVENWEPNYPGDLIACNDRSGMRLGIDTLQKLGHERILFLVSEPEEFNSTPERVQIFEEITAQYSLTKAKVFHCGVHSWENSAQAATEAMSHIWNSQDRPTAIFTISDRSALGVYHWIRSNGFVLPKDMSLLSFDGVESAVREFNFSTLVKPIDSIVLEAFRLLKNPRSVPKHIFLDPTLQVGGTIGPLVLPDGEL